MNVKTVMTAGMIRKNHIWNGGVISPKNRYVIIVTAKIIRNTLSIIMNYPQPTMSDGVSVIPLCGMNLQDLYILQNRACPLCPYPIGLPLGILFLRYLLHH